MHVSANISRGVKLITSTHRQRNPAKWLQNPGSQWCLILFFNIFKETNVFFYLFKVWNQSTDCGRVCCAGGYAIASALRWKGADLFAKSNLQDIYLNGEVAGQEKSGGGLTWIQQPGLDTMDVWRWGERYRKVVCCGYLKAERWRNPCHPCMVYFHLYFVDLYGKCR